MSKSPDAFRTISEVADWLGIQAHVLRFWESKFSQVKPVKRAGGRRYYRPNDMLLLGGIRRLLHEDGLTIKGVQKILREEGISHVAALSQPLDDLTQSELAEAPDDIVLEHVPEAAEEKGVILSFDPAASQQEPAAEPEAEALSEVMHDPAPAAILDAEPDTASGAEETDVDAAEQAPAVPAEEIEEPAPSMAAEAEMQEVAEPEAPEAGPEETAEAPHEEPTADQSDTEDAPEHEVAHPVVATAPPEPEREQPESAEEPARTAAALPAFLRRPMADPPASDNTPVEAESAAPPPPPRARDIGMPAITPLDQIDARPGALTAAMRARHLTPEQAREIAPLLARLTALRDSMASRRRPGPPD